MTSARSDATVTLTLSLRDAQWIAATLGVCATLLSYAPDDITECNIDSLSQLFHDQYSGAEAEALTWRARSLLPADTLLQFSDGPFAVPQPPIIQ